MSAETLRRAAALMRERAEATFLTTDAGDLAGWHTPADLVGTFDEDGDGDFVASMSPTFALAVADLLDNEANAMARADGFARDYAEVQTAAYNEARRSLLLAVGRAYLGES